MAQHFEYHTNVFTVDARNFKLVQQPNHPIASRIVRIAISNLQMNENSPRWIEQKTNLQQKKRDQ